MLARSDNLDLNDATLTTANAVDGVDAEPATVKQPRHQKLSHRISPVFRNVPVVLACMLRLSGDSEGKFSAVILKAHRARGGPLPLSASGQSTDPPSSSASAMWIFFRGAGSRAFPTAKQHCRSSGRKARISFGSGAIGTIVGLSTKRVITVGKQVQRRGVQPLSD